MDGGVANAYNDLERAELRSRQTSFDAHPREFSCWLSGISLLSEMAKIPWDLTGSKSPSETIQAGLAGLGLTASKSSFDAPAGGNYPAAFASSRLGFESAFMIVAIELLPDLAGEWYRRPKGHEFHIESPRVRAVFKRIESDPAMMGHPVMGFITHLKDIIHQASIGTHPTKDALTPLMGTPANDEWQLLAFRAVHAIYALKFGLFLNSAIMTAIRPVRWAVCRSEDRGRLADWEQRVEDWQRWTHEIDVDLAATVNALGETNL